MASDHEEEMKFLALANEKRKFAISITAELGEAGQKALERLQTRGWIRLIDVSMIAARPGQLFRIFLLEEGAELALGRWQLAQRSAKGEKLDG